MAGFIPKLPLKLDTSQGYYMIDDLQTLVKQNFLMLLLTNPGERVMDSNFGVGLRKLLFENYTYQNISTFERRLNSQVSRYAPYIKIMNIDYGQSQEGDNLLSVRIDVFIIPLGNSKTITIQSDGQLLVT